jgi:flagellin
LTYDAAVTAAGAGTTYANDTPGQGLHDHAMTITARDPGVDMAGVNIFFTADQNLDVGQIEVKFNTLENGEKQLIVRGNVADDEISGTGLVALLNANSDFNTLFNATAGPFGAGLVAFRAVNWNNPHAVTEGGYRIESSMAGLDASNTTSSGVNMTGQSDSNERLIIESEELGSAQFVQVNIVDGRLNLSNQWNESANYSEGVDMQASINGIRASAEGNNIAIDTSSLSVSMNVVNMTGQTGFNITGGGALFQLGPEVVSQQQIRIGIGSMLTTNLGGSDGNLNMLRTGNVAALTSDDNGRKLADRIVTQAIESVATTRGRLGAIQRGTLEPNVLALQDSLTAMTEANAGITNADFAVESSNLTRLQLLIQAGMQTLGIANQMPQYAAQLVR